jgi:hypothetical protein
MSIASCLQQLRISNVHATGANGQSCNRRRYCEAYPTSGAVIDNEGAAVDQLSDSNYRFRDLLFGFTFKSRH